MGCCKKRKDQNQNVFSRLTVLLSLVIIFAFGFINNLYAADTKKINDIEFQASDSVESIVISSDKKLLFSDVKKLSPLGIVIYFPGTELINDVKVNTDNSEIVKSVSTSYFSDNKTTRIEILLNKDLYYRISNVGNVLKITFDNPDSTLASTNTNTSEQIEEAKPDDVVKPAEQVAVTQTEPSKEAEMVSDTSETPDDTEAPAIATVEQPATEEKEIVDEIELYTVDVEEKINETVIFIKTSKNIDDFNSFTINEPARIVVDLPNVKGTKKGEQKIEINSVHAQNVRYFSYPERLRLVIDTNKAYLKSYKTIAVNDGLQISIKGMPIEETAVVVADEPTEEKEVVVEEVIAQNEVMVSSKKESVKPEKPAVINVIEFTSEKDGNSLVTIQTSYPVTYDLKKVSEKKINLHLYNTFIPDFRKRQLITTRFDSAVNRITPVQTKQMGSNALFVIELREDVEFNSVQDNNTINIQIAASDIPPIPVDQANLPEWQKILNEEMVFEEDARAGISNLKRADEKPKDANTKLSAKSETINSVLDVTEQRVFSGEKIAIDFYETDIKNVFRIIQSISGKNFAIDKDVSGTVTLNIEKPAPWDQILDLVLKMNGLGMIYEGDIIRIATRSTVKKEDEFKKSVLLQKRKNMEDAKALEPLVTHYIPISYANAEEVKTQIDPLLTQGRGSSSTDSRTNQVIITDTKGTIDRILATVREIDKITPQVMIEARIVEANKNFTRELGVNWNLSQNKNLGFQNGNVNLDTFMNFPAGQKLFDFTFSKIPGDFLLDAELYAMETNGDGKIISSPRVLTIDNTEANIKQGFELPYNKLDESGNTTTEFKEVILELSVTPHVTPDKRVALKLKITKNGVFQMTDAGPSISTKETSTELLVNNTSTVVIGGITQEEVGYDVNGVPWLKDIPGLGYLFKNTTKRSTMTELLIFITPNIITLEEVN